MTLRNLRIFLKVAQTMNMTSAAAALGISQSAVSQAVAELERYLGRKLFRRSAGTISLTVQGIALLEYARRIDQLCAEAEESVKSIAAESINMIRLGYTVFDNARFVMPGLSALYRRHSRNVQLITRADRVEENERLLLEGALDFVLVQGTSHARGIASMPLVTEQRVFICAENSRLVPLDAQGYLVGGRGRLSSLDFCIRDDGSEMADRNFKMEMSQCGVDPRIFGVFFSYEEVKRVVAADLGIGVIKKGAGYPVEGIREFRVEGINLTHTLTLLYNRRKKLGQLEYDFIDFLRDHL